MNFTIDEGTLNHPGYIPLLVVVGVIVLVLYIIVKVVDKTTPDDYDKKQEAKK